MKMAAALQENTCSALQSINLSGNPIEDKGGSVIAEYWKKRTRIGAYFLQCAFLCEVATSLNCVRAHVFVCVRVHLFVFNPRYNSTE